MDEDNNNGSITILNGDNYEEPKEVKGMGRVGIESLNLEVWGKPPKGMIFELRTVKKQIRLGDKRIPGK